MGQIQAHCKQAYLSRVDFANLKIANPNYCRTGKFIRMTNNTRIAWVMDFERLESLREIRTDAKTDKMLDGKKTC